MLKMIIEYNMLKSVIEIQYALKEKSVVNHSIALFFQVSQWMLIVGKWMWKCLIQHRPNSEQAADTYWMGHGDMLSLSFSQLAPPAALPFGLCVLPHTDSIWWSGTTGIWINPHWIPLNIYYIYTSLCVCQYVTVFICMPVCVFVSTLCIRWPGAVTRVSWEESWCHLTLSQLLGCSY